MDLGELRVALASFGYKLSPRFLNFLGKRFDKAGENRILLDDFIQACILLESVTSVFRDRDVGRKGAVMLEYEDWCIDVLGLIFRLQAYPD